ncbi:MAG: helix-turn-helix domain-containing protein [Armatimonadota bacterium]
MRLEDWYKYVEQLEKGQQEEASPDQQPAAPPEKPSAEATAAALAAESPAQSAPLIRPVERTEDAAPALTGSLFEADEVLARPIPPSAASPAAPASEASSIPPITPGDLDIPEIEEFLPFLKEKETDGKDATKPEAAAPPAQAPVTPARPSAAPAPSVPPDSATARRNGGDASTQAIRQPVTPVQKPSPESAPAAAEQKASVAPATPPTGTVPQTPQPAVRKSPEGTADKPVQSSSAQTAGAEKAPSTAAKPQKPATRPAPAPPPVPESGVEEEEQAAEPVWNRLPAHLQAFASMQVEEVAQRSYKRGFRESRQELLARLLDPPLSLEEAARILNVCPTTVRRYTNRGLLPHFRTAGNQRRFRFSDIVAFMESQQHAGRRKRARRTGEETENTDS